MSYLVLVRHGQSKWNALGLWTGFTDIELSPTGKKEARRAAKTLEDIEFHKAHVSKLKRAKQTLREIQKALKLSHIPVSEHEALNERHYGELTGKNKWEIKKLYGDEQFHKIRRSWDHPIPGGESLKDVHARVVPYFESEILKDLKEGKNVIVSAHGNSLRALMKHLDNVPDEKIADVEIATGEVHVYLIDNDGKVQSKEIRGTTEFSGKK